VLAFSSSISFKESPKMGKRIFVGNLPFSANDQVLNDTFAQYGTVESAKVIVDRATGRSKGFGFVEMSTDAEATTAIEKLNGAEYEGRTITVNEAQEMQPREAGAGGGGGRGRPGGGRGGRGGGGRGAEGGGGRGRY
jgi:RNA recognition motif-containing protein